MKQEQNTVFIIELSFCVYEYHSFNQRSVKAYKKALWYKNVLEFDIIFANEFLTNLTLILFTSKKHHKDIFDHRYWDTVDELCLTFNKQGNVKVKKKN